MDLFNNNVLGMLIAVAAVLSILMMRRRTNSNVDEREDVGDLDLEEIRLHRTPFLWLADRVCKLLPTDPELEHRRLVFTEVSSIAMAMVFGFLFETLAWFKLWAYTDLPQIAQYGLALASGFLIMFVIEGNTYKKPRDGWSWQVGFRLTFVMAISTGLGTLFAMSTNTKAIEAEVKVIWAEQIEVARRRLIEEARKQFDQKQAVDQQVTNAQLQVDRENLRRKVERLTADRDRWLQASACLSEQRPTSCPQGHAYITNPRDRQAAIRYRDKQVEQAEQALRQASLKQDGMQRNNAAVLAQAQQQFNSISDQVSTLTDDAVVARAHLSTPAGLNTDLRAYARVVSKAGFAGYATWLLYVILYGFLTCAILYARSTRNPLIDDYYRGEALDAEDMMERATAIQQRKLLAGKLLGRRELAMQIRSDAYEEYYNALMHYDTQRTVVLQQALAGRLQSVTACEAALASAHSAAFHAAISLKIARAGDDRSKSLLKHGVNDFFAGMRESFTRAIQDAPPRRTNGSPNRHADMMDGVELLN